MYRIIYSLTCSLLFLITMPAQAIVNMDGLHFDKLKQDTFTADMDLTARGSTGNSESSRVSFNSQVSWISEKSINLAILGHEYGKSNNVRNINKSFVHYRYIYRLDETMDLEIFTQLETNEFTRLSYRGLLGTGLRFIISDTDNHRAFLGAGGFYSKEKTEFTVGLTDHGTEEFSRGNFYFLSKYKLNSSVSFSNAIYYQPRLSEFSDYRALLESKLDFSITEKLKLRLSLDISHDSRPSQTIETTDTSYMTGLSYHF